MSRLWKTLPTIVFWYGLPLAVAIFLLWPKQSVLYVDVVTFALELNPVRSTLPWPFSELIYFYPATLLALVVLAFAVKRLIATGALLSPSRVPAFFLPTYVAGLESIKLVLWSTRCHSLTDPRPEETIVGGALLSAATLGFTILACAWALKHGRVDGARRIPSGVAAFTLSIGIIWWILWRLVTPA